MRSVDQLFEHSLFQGMALDKIGYCPDLHSVGISDVAFEMLNAVPFKLFELEHVGQFQQLGCQQSVVVDVTIVEDGCGLVVVVVALVSEFCLRLGIDVLKEADCFQAKQQFSLLTFLFEVTMWLKRFDSETEKMSKKPLKNRGRF